jgi:UDPglucose 6-dehydrogenase
MRVAVFGMGYVGLVTAAGLAKWGHEVIGIEVDHERLDALRAGRLPLFEPGLDALVEGGVAGKRLRFTDRLDGIAAVQVAIVAVGTHDGNGGWQTDTIQSCFAGMVPQLADDAVLVVRSTLPPEFLPRIRPMIDSLRAAAGRGPVPVVVNPEFTREGSAVMDYLEPDRIVIGVISDDTGAGVRQLRRMYHSVTAPFLVMPSEDAVLAKLGANLFLATKISFANELAMLCEAYNADVTQVVEAMSHDARIGGAFLRAGVGFGGSCLPHQVTMTVHAAEAAGRETPLLAAVDKINHQRRFDFVARLEDAVGGTLEGARVAILGLTFKPGTDDLREAPSLTIAEAAIAAGAEVVAYDPMPSARSRAERLVPGLQIAESAAEALAGADVAGLVTEWSEFTHLDWAALRDTMNRPAIVDGRNALDPEAIAAAGFRYTGFGRRAAGAVPVQVAGGNVVAWPSDPEVRLASAGAR